MRHRDGEDVETLLQFADLATQLGAHLSIERRNRLVQQQKARLDRHCAGRRHALLLVAGALIGIAVGELAQADEAEQLDGALRMSMVRLRARRGRCPKLLVFARRNDRRACGIDADANTLTD